MRSLVATVFVVVVACAPATERPSAAAAPSASQIASARPDRAAAWRADIATLIPGMAALHPNLTHSASRAQLEDAAAALAAAVPSLTDDQILVGLMRIVGTVTSGGCDAHTGLYVWGEGSYPVDSLPLRVWWFDEGIYVIDARPPYRELIGARIDAVNGRAMSEILAAIAPLVPRDNDTTLRLLAPRYVVIPQVLRGLGLIGADPLTLEVTPPGGPQRRVGVAPIAMSEYNDWAGGYGLFLPDDPNVLYLSRASEPLWWTALDGGAVLYVQYNRAVYLSQATIDGLHAALATTHDKVVVDIRHNYGGDIGSVAPVLAALRDPSVDRAGRLFVVTGRNTFSAASMFLARLQAATSAVVVGEPMGGCPNPIGNARPLPLRNSGLVVEVGTSQETAVSADDHRHQIPPALPARLTPEAWRAKVDPALAAIRAYRP
ncbi:MAG TPA: hypothetical protein VEU77_00845 [Candidatus Acidoferrales bacterium]|nr:hypothetical protein [Candidatus Acidoferrales bacterium]